MAAARALIGVLACGLALTGCGLLHSGSSRSTQSRVAAGSSTAAQTATSSQSAADDPDAAGPGDNGPPSPRTPQLPPGDTSPTPQGALARFAQMYVNWSASQLAQRSRQLAAISVGQARAQAQRLSTRGRALTRYQVTNRGSVTAIARGQGQEQGRWVVVTNELTSGLGPYLGLPATSAVAWATVTRQRNGYVVSGWYPAS